MKDLLYITRKTEKLSKDGSPVYYLATTSGLLLCTKDEDVYKETNLWGYYEINYERPQQYPYIWKFSLLELVFEPMGTFKATTHTQRVSGIKGVYYKTPVTNENGELLFLCSKSIMKVQKDSILELVYQKGNGKFAHWIWNFHIHTNK